MTDQKIPPIGSHVLSTLILQTPLHAWTASKYLNPNYQDEKKVAFDLGTVVHRMILENETEEGFAILDYPAYTTKAARLDRDAAYDAGETPILRHHHDNALAMYEAAQRQLPHLENCTTIGDSRHGKAEVKMEFEHENVLCRCRLDWVPNQASPEGTVLHDLKTTNSVAEPGAWARQNLFLRGAVQGAYYRYVNFMATGVDRYPLFVVIETKPPYAMSVVKPPEEMLTAAEAMVVKGLATYQECCETGHWPGYSTRMHTPEPAPWHIMEAEAKS